MDQGPLVREEIEAGAELARRFDKSEPVKAAFWLRVPDDDERYLYLVIGRDRNTSFRPAYEALVRSMLELRNPDLDMLRVKLIGFDDPMGQAAIEMQQHYPASLSRRAYGVMFGNRFAGDLYVYPPLVPISMPG